LNTCDLDPWLQGEFHHKQPGHLAEIGASKIGPGEIGLFQVRLT
jgi:hypothetical protein